MIIDASALIAIILEEPEWEVYFRAILGTRNRLMPVVTWLEASMVLEGKGDDVAVSRFDNVLSEFGIRLLDFDRSHAAEARRAFRLYGRGQGHRARLNFGDCMVYAVAKLPGGSSAVQGQRLHSHRRRAGAESLI